MALANARHLAHGIELEGFDIGVKPGQPLPHLRILEHGFSIEGTHAAQFNESLQTLFENNYNGERQTPRSCIKVVMATIQPLFSSPTRFSTGTLIFSKNSSANSASPVIWTSGLVLTPGDFISTIR